MNKELNKKLVIIFSGLAVLLTAVIFAFAFPSIAKADNDASGEIANTELSASEDLEPDVSISNKEDVFNNWTIVIESSRGQVFHPQYFTKSTLKKAFEKVALIADQNFWNQTRDYHNIFIKVHKYALIASEALSQTTINDAVASWPKEKFSPLSDEVKVNLDRIKFTHADCKEVTFDGENCIHDIPGLRYIDTERVNWAKGCIKNLPSLLIIHNENVSAGWSVSELCDSIVNVHDCTAENTVSVGYNNMTFYYWESTWHGNQKHKPSPIHTNMLDHS